MDFSFINYVSNKDFDLHEIRVSSLGKERKSANIIPVVSDLTDLIDKIDNYVLGFQKLFRLMIGPTKDAAIDTLKSIRDYAACNDKNKKSNGMYTYMVYLEELKLLSRITTMMDIENYTYISCKLYLFL